MAKKKHKRQPRRGYPVAILVIFEARRALLWQVFSEAVKPLTTVKFIGKRDDIKALYAFHEKLVDALRPALKEGINSVILVSPPKALFSAEFLEHVQAHHLWLVKAKSPNAVTFGTMEGIAVEHEDVTILVQSEEFQAKINEITGEEADQIIATLEKRMQKPSSDKEPVLYSLAEIESAIYTRDPSEIRQPEYIILTDQFLAENPEKNRVQRLLQIAKNKNVKTRIIKAESAAGERLTQFGGLVWFKFTGKDP
jgi:stalled ribosome rescue protein Dom34